jgi:hypothetical protein
MEVSTLHLYDFAYLSNKEDSLKVVSMMMDDGETDVQQLLRQLFETFERRYAAQEICYYLKDGSPSDQEQGEICMFKTDFQTQGGDDIWARFVRNLRTEASQKWFGVWFVAKNSLLDFVENKFVIGNIFFPDWHSGLDFLDKLAATAIPEKWNYDAHKSKINHPILKSYIEHMYYRLETEDKIIANDKQIVFNTGLLNKFFKEIYIICDVDFDKNLGIRILRNPSICLEGENRFTRNFDTKPSRAVFFTDISEIIFDSSLGVDTNDSHIIRDNIERIPEKYRELYTDSQLYMLFQSAVSFASRLAERNYKLIVPQYWPKTNGIQFLMPIYLSGEFAGRPDLALVLEKRATCYQGTTILTLDMAYQNARLVAKPDDFWLNP